MLLTISNVASWPFTPFRCNAAIRLESGVDRTRCGHDRSDVIDPIQTSRPH